MKLRLSLFAVMIALPLLYISGARLQDRHLSTLALLFVATLCLWLLAPERNR